MEHKISAFVSTCIFAIMMASCTVSTHTTARPTPPPPPPPAHHMHPHPHHHGPGPKRYPIDQFRRGPQAPQHHHKGPQAPPPPAKSNSVRDVERNRIRNSGTAVPQQRNSQETKSGSVQQSNPSPRSSSSTPSSNTRSQRSERSSNSGSASSSRSGGGRR